MHLSSRILRTRNSGFSFLSLFFRFPSPIREIASFQYLSFTASNLRNINRLIPRFLFPASSSPVVLIFLLPFFPMAIEMSSNWDKFVTKITELKCIINMSVKVRLLNLLKSQFSTLTQSQLDFDVTFELSLKFKHINNVFFASRNIVIYYLIALAHWDVTLVELYWFKWKLTEKKKVTFQTIFNVISKFARTVCIKFSCLMFTRKIILEQLSQ